MVGGRGRRGPTRVELSSTPAAQDPAWWVGVATPLHAAPSPKCSPARLAGLMQLKFLHW